MESSHGTSSAEGKKKLASTGYEHFALRGPYRSKIPPFFPQGVVSDSESSREHNPCLAVPLHPGPLSMLMNSVSDREPSPPWPTLPRPHTLPRQRVFPCHHTRLRLPSILTATSITIHSICTHVRSTIFRFFQLIISCNFGSPHLIVLCQFYPLSTKTLVHCLLSPPNSETTSMTLCARFLFRLRNQAMFLCWKNVLVYLFGSLVATRAMCPHHEK